MNKILLLSILSTLLFAQNPDIYPTLGDKVYNNVDKIKKLKNIPEFRRYEDKIDEYVLDIWFLKEDAVVVKSKDDNISKHKYLERLKELNIVYNSFLKDVENSLKKSIKDENSRLFLSLFNSGLINTVKYKKEIIDYYLKHSSEIGTAKYKKEITDYYLKHSNEIDSTENTQTNLDEEKQKVIKEHQNPTIYSAVDKVKKKEKVIKERQDLKIYPVVEKEKQKVVIERQNPNIYSSLGDKVYSNVDKIKKLKDIPEFEYYEDKIDEYILDIELLREDGFVVRSKDDNISKHKYLKRLRELYIVNNSFLKDVEKSLKKSIKDENSRLFLSLVNSGLLDTAKYKKDIVDYYLSHSNEIDPTGVMQTYIDEEKKKQKIIKERIKKVQTSQKDIEAARIERIRKRDRLEKEKAIKLLNEEVSQKKQEIRDNQKKELSED